MENTALINSYFHGGSSKFRDGYRITSMDSNLTGILDYLSIRDKVGAAEFIRNIIVSIFIHETTYIKSTDLFLIFKYMSVQSAIQLLRSDTIKLIDDNGLSMAFLVDPNNKKHLCFMENSYMYPGNTKAEHFDTSLDYISFEASKIGLPIEIKQPLLYHIEKKSTFLAIDDIIEKMKHELDYDLKNSNITNKLGIANLEIENLPDSSIDKAFRLIKSNQGLLYSALLNTDNLISESSSVDDYERKFNNQSLIKQNVSLDSFNHLANRLGIPDFSEMITTGVMSLDDFLKLREKKGTLKFRQWFNDLKHDKDATISYLLSDIPRNSNKNTITKILRWAFTNAIGIIEPISGVAASVADSFILDKLTRGWSPNLFLNRNLKDYLNKLQEKKAKEHSNNLHEKYFGKVSRNELCPCQSGKKHKHCCGR
jgi:hypothetical protein